MASRCDVGCLTRGRYISGDVVAALFMPKIRRFVTPVAVLAVVCLT